jgi:hypothetical protein
VKTAQTGSDKKMERAIEALLSCGTIVEAAEQSRVPRRTLTRWLADPDFQRRLRDARRESWTHGSARLCRLLAKAIDVISNALDGTEINKGRFLSAKLVIESCRDIQGDDLEGRVAELEQRLLDRHAAYRRRLDGMSDDQLKEQLETLKRKALEGFSSEQLEGRLAELRSGGPGGGTE